jgi:hypothetical protein
MGFHGVVRGLPTQIPTQNNRYAKLSAAASFNRFQRPDKGELVWWNPPTLCLPHGNKLGRWGGCSEGRPQVLRRLKAVDALGAGEILALREGAISKICSLSVLLRGLLRPNGN